MSAVTGFISLLLLLCCIILPANPAVAAEGGNTAGGVVVVSKFLVAGQEVNEVQDVQVIFLDKGKPEHRLLRPGSSLPPGVEIIAPARTVIIFTSSNGNLITLNPGSRLRVNTVSGEGESYTTLEGLFNFEVFKALSFFRVNYQTFVALVKGTQYSVQVEPGKEIRFTVSQGKVEIIRDVKVKIEEGDKVVTGLKEAEVISAEGRRSVIYRLDVSEYLKVFKTYKDAEDYYRRQLEEDLKSGDDERIQRGRNNLGQILLDRGKFQESIPYFESNLTSTELRKNDESIATSYKNLGEVYRSLGEYHRAIDYYEKGLAISLQLSPDGQNPDIAIIYNNLGIAYSYLGSTYSLLGGWEMPDDNCKACDATWKSRPEYSSAYRRAIDYYDKALKIRLQLYPGGPYPGNAMSYINKLHIAMIYTNLSIAHAALGEYDLALDYAKKVIEQELVNKWIKWQRQSDEFTKGQIEQESLEDRLERWIEQKQIERQRQIEQKSFKRRRKGFLEGWPPEGGRPKERLPRGQHLK